MSSGRQRKKRTKPEIEPPHTQTGEERTLVSKIKMWRSGSGEKHILSKTKPATEERNERRSSHAPQLELFTRNSSSNSLPRARMSTPVHMSQFNNQRSDADKMNEALSGLDFAEDRRPLDPLDSRTRLIENGPRMQEPTKDTKDWLNYDGARVHSPPRDRLGAADDLRNIEIILIKAGYDFKELRAPAGNEPVEEAVQRFIKQYHAKALDLDQAHQNLEAAHQLVSDQSKLQERIKSMEYELHGTKNAYRTANGELQTIKKELFYARQRNSEQAAAYEKEKNILRTSLEREINTLKHAIHEINYDHEVALGAEKSLLISEKNRLEAIYEEQVRQARTDEAKLQAEEVRRQAETIRNLTAESQTTHQRWLDWVEEVKSDYERKLSGMKSGYESELSEKETKYSSERLEMDTAHRNALQHEKDKLRRAISEYEAEIRKLRVDAEGEIEQLKFDTEVEKRRLRDDAEVDKRKLREDAENEQLQLRQEVETFRTRALKEKARRERDLEKQKDALVSQHQQDTFQLRSAYENAKLGLFKREHFKGLRDRDVTGLFTTIVGQVRDFANLDWDPKRQSEWPFEDDQLQDIHRQNTRKLKKQLLQNSIWNLLYSFVFRSPFRVLGPEGRDVDSDWVHIHTPNTSSLEWPEISPEMEKRRYETANAFLAVIDPSAKASGSDLRLKASYEGAVTNTLDALYRALSKVSSLEPRHHKMLENLVRLCAKTWMQFCSQPYRLIVTLPPGSGDLLSSPQRNERALTLVISPELKRYGNSQGENLTRGEVVPDCQAAVQAYPTR